MDDNRRDLLQGIGVLCGLGAIAMIPITLWAGIQFGLSTIGSNRHYFDNFILISFGGFAIAITLVLTGIACRSKAKE